jgi:hypothetical protein
MLTIVLLIGCSDDKDKFIGKWNFNDELHCEIKNDDGKYTCQMYSKGEENALYDELFISDEGYLLSESKDRFIGYEYVDKYTLNSITIWKDNDNDKTPNNANKEVDFELKRGN